MEPTPIRFGIVEPGVYRSDVPKLHNFPFLRQLGLQTCLLLTPKPLRELVKRLKYDSSTRSAWSSALGTGS